MNGKGGRWWVGSDKVRENGITVITDCVLPGAALLTPTSVHAGLYGSKRETALLGWVMYHYGASPSDAVAAGGRLAMLKIVGRPIPGLKVPAKIAAYAKADLANAQRNAGPGTGSVVFGGKPATPGQSAGVKMDVTSASGHAITGIPVRFTAVSAQIAAGAGSGGWRAFTRTSPAPVTVTGAVTVASAVVTIGTAPHGQTLISALAATVTATASYQASPAPVRSAVECNCDGTGNPTGTVTQAAGSAEGQYTLYVNGKATATVTIRAGKHAQSAELKAGNVPDGWLVAFTARYRIGGRWTAPVALGGSFTVICPVMPVVRCACAAGGTGYAQALTLDNASNPFAEIVTWTAGGKTYTATVPAFGSKTVTVVLKPGELLDYYGTVRAGGVTATTLTGITGTKQ
jgi:hypothetical protein